jgi:hypothetical protein
VIAAEGGWPFQTAKVIHISNTSVEIQEMISSGDSADHPLKQPRTASILVEDYLRPAAMKAGILSSYRNEVGKLVENDPRRFGFHNL